MMSDSRTQAARPLKVLHVLGRPTAGGIEKLVLDLCGVQSRDPATDVAVLFMQATADSDLFTERYRDLGVRLHSLGMRSGYDMSIGKFRKAKRIFREFDIIHLHVFDLGVAIAAVMAHRHLVYTEHGTFGKGRRRRLSDRVNGWLLKLFLNIWVNLVTFNSHWTEQFACKRYGLRRVKTAMIYNGIDLPREAPSPQELDQQIATKLSGKFVIGTTARFAGFKRIDRLIEAFGKFRAGRDTSLLLVGDGILRPELEDQVDRLGLADCVIFAGYQANARAYQNAMDVCVFPSETEPFGLVSVEAFSLGKPVLVFDDCGGMKEIVETISPENVVDGIDTMADRLAYYYDRRNVPDPQTAARIKHAGTFSIEAMAARFKEQYRALNPCAA